MFARANIDHHLAGGHQDVILSLGALARTALTQQRLAGTTKSDTTTTTMMIMMNHLQWPVVSTQTGARPRVGFSAPGSVPRACPSHQSALLSGASRSPLPRAGQISLAIRHASHLYSVGAPPPPTPAPEASFSALKMAPGLEYYQASLQGGRRLAIIAPIIMVRACACIGPAEGRVLRS